MVKRSSFSAYGKLKKCHWQPLNLTDTSLNQLIIQHPTNQLITRLIFDKILVMGCIFPKQHVLCTTIVSTITKEPCAIITIGTIYGRRGYCRCRTWRKDHWRSFGCASNHPKLPGNEYCIQLTHFYTKFYVDNDFSHWIYSFMAINGLKCFRSTISIYFFFSFSRQGFVFVSLDIFLCIVFFLYILNAPCQFDNF